MFKTARHELISQDQGKRDFNGVITAALIYLLIVAPFTINLFRDKIVNPPPDEPSHYSANLAGFFIPGQERDQAELYGAPLTTPLYGQVFAAVDSQITVGIGGFEIFVGFPLLLFSGRGAAAIQAKTGVVVRATGFVFFVLSLGPTLKILGTETGIPMPYSLLMNIPPFDTGRTPVRFVVMGLFFLMIVAAVGLSWTESFVAARWGRPLGPAWRCCCCSPGRSREVYSPTQHRRSFVAAGGPE